MEDLRPIVRLLQNQRWNSAKEIREFTGSFVDNLDQAIAMLKERGLLIDCHIDQGYRLMEQVTLIDEDRLKKLLVDAGSAITTSISVVDAIDSTSSQLLNWVDPFTLHGRVCIAEFQSEGRGRRGQSWVASGYQNITLSLAWRVEKTITELSAISLAVGVVVCDSLEEIGVDGVRLKWPNDVISPDGKLAGILIETKNTVAGDLYVVIGVGLNINNSSFVQTLVKQPTANLREMLDSGLDRTSLLAQLLTRLSAALEKMNQTGFSDFKAKWNERDAYKGLEVVATVGAKQTRGLGLGIDGVGAYLVRDSRGGICRLISGDVRLRQHISSYPEDFHSYNIHLLDGVFRK